MAHAGAMNDCYDLDAVVWLIEDVVHDRVAQDAAAYAFVVARFWTSVRGASDASEELVKPGAHCAGRHRIVCCNVVEYRLQFDFSFRCKNDFARNFHDCVLLGRQFRATPFLGLGKEPVKIPLAPFALGDAVERGFDFALGHGPLRTFDVVGELRVALPRCGRL